MKKSLLSSVAVIAFATHLSVAAPATAQDSVANPASFFQGFYIGGHGVVGGVTFDGIFDNTDPPGVGLGSTEGLGGGIHFGYNQVLDQNPGMFDAIVFGIEGDLTFVNWDDSQFDGGSIYHEAELNTLSSIRLRSGVVKDGFLLFVTGGISFADWEYSVLDTSNNTAGSTNMFGVGGVVGGGVEFPLFDFALVRVEGLYYFFGDRKDLFGIIGTADPGDYVKLQDAYAVRAGISIPLQNIFGAFN